LAELQTFRNSGSVFKTFLAPGFRFVTLQPSTFRQPALMPAMEMAAKTTEGWQIVIVLKID
jgi:hypothetical protein